MANSTRGAATGGAPAKTSSIKVHGLELDVPLQLPFAALEHVPDPGTDPSAQQVFRLLAVILGDAQMTKVKAAGLTMDQGVELFGAVMEAAGAGGSPASPTN